MVTFQFKPTKDDYLKAFRTFYLSVWQIWMVLIFIALSQFLCIIWAFIIGSMDWQSVGFVPIMFLVIIVAILAYVLVMHPLQLATKVERDERLSSPVQGEANEEQITFKTKFSETKLDWGSYHKVIESRDQFLLVHSANKSMFQIIPKRAFASVDDERIFRDLLKVKVPNKQRSSFDFKNPAIILSILFAAGLFLFLCAFAVVALLTKFVISE